MKSAAKKKIVDEETEEAIAANALGAVLRDAVKSIQPLKCSESARVLESSDAVMAADGTSWMEGPKVSVVLITEGLGNRKNMNYYGSEAIQSAPALFEGKPAFLDHPTESDSRDIPERRVRDKCGYFKNCRVESRDGVLACVGELHFDLSESGREGYLKACSALHYQKEFPGFNDEYVGLSINADGEVDERAVTVDGEALEVNYVTRFTAAASCDVVTSPARGGKFLALVESAAGAKPSKEDGPMKDRLKKSLEAAQSALIEADKETDAAKKAVKVSEAVKLHQAFVQEARKEAAESKESAEEAEAREAKKKEDDAEEAAADAKKKKEKKADDEDDKDDAIESNRIVIAALAKEAGIEKFVDVERLAGLSLAEAKADIAERKKFKEAVVAAVVSEMSAGPVNREKLSESDRAALSSKNNGMFDCIR